MFIGSQTGQLDDKNRIRIPAKFKEDMGKDFYLTRGAGNCIQVMPKEAFERMTAPFQSIPFSDTKAREAVRAILSTVEQPEEDGQGRFVIPAQCKQYAHIDKKVVFKGAGDYVEIWRDEDVSNFDSISDAMEVLAKYGV